MYRDHTDARESLALLAWASALTLVLWFLPYVGYALYPVRLFVTFVHEICHATAALLTLGSPLSIELFWNGSGLTKSSGGLRLVVQAAGYVVTPLVGAGLLLLAARKRTVRPALIGTGLALVGATVLLGVGLPTWIAGLVLGPALIVFGLYAPPRAARFGLSFLAVQCMLNAIGDLATLFYLSVGGPDIPNDAQLMSDATLGLVPAIVWTVVWAALSLVTLAAALRAYYRLTASRGASLVSGLDDPV